MRQRIGLLALFFSAFAVVYGYSNWSAPSDQGSPRADDEPVRSFEGDGTPSGDAPPGMVWVPGGEFAMGTNWADAWPEERPEHRVRVGGFWMDLTEVTNAEFAKFVDATSYVTVAERAPVLEEIMKQVPPGVPPPPPETLVPGSLVFHPTAIAVPLDDYTQWWNWTPGANWRQPEGPGSDLKGREIHPVVQVSWDDAKAYADWAGKRLPTEAEWEFAARGGLSKKRFTWGDELLTPRHANIWQGEFPFTNAEADGYYRTAPVKSFPANGYGLHDMAGNVWEWCADWYDRKLYSQRAASGLVDNPQGPAVPPTDPANPQAFAPQRVQRGGSFLCCDQYCSRYRPSARHGGAPDTGMSHVGFRCVRSATAK
ncbi:MAG: formylglycine-generating enzyme family protein [Planctomycetia bacterium]|nr:formylglycine-generating enzyme family protein [Planctomycetia bacterium]